MEGSPEASGRATRRGFLNRVIVTLGGLLAILTIYPLFKYIWPYKERSRGEALAIPLELVPLNGYKIRDFRNGKIIIIRTDRKVVALSATCTHLGCMVAYDELGFIICPCHAGKFDLNGNVISGPPPRPLYEYSVRVTQNRIVIGG